MSIAAEGGLARREPRLWRHAAAWLALLGPFFFASYGAANWLTAQRSEVGAIAFEWEHTIPFWPWTIVPYWSIDVFYAISLFVCTSRAEIDTHAKRLITAQVLAVACFILFPLTFSFPRPPSDGLAGIMFDALMSFDKPFNQAPSLHIALLIILWPLYARHVPARGRWVLHAWFALILVSVLTTYQHHFIDIPTGAWLGFLCLWLWPDEGRSPLTQLTFASDHRRHFLAACYALGATVLAALAFWTPPIGLWLLWPAAALALVAFIYIALGPDGFQKFTDGSMSLGARWMLAPYLLGAWINSRLWTRHEPGRHPSPTAWRWAAFRPPATPPPTAPLSISAPSCRAQSPAAPCRCSTWPRPIPSACDRPQHSSKARAKPARSWSAARWAIRAAPPPSRSGCSRPDAPRASRPLWRKSARCVRASSCAARPWRRSRPPRGPLHERHPS